MRNVAVHPSASTRAALCQTASHDGSLWSPSANTYTSRCTFVGVTVKVYAVRRSWYESIDTRT